jgi:hypothetical protein
MGSQYKDKDEELLRLLPQTSGADYFSDDEESFPLPTAASSDLRRASRGTATAETGKA